jgi:chromate transporter
LNAPVSFLTALKFWLKLGFISFGGPAGQIAIMHAELVDRRRWISEHRFLHALNYCMTLPGPEAQQLATYLGWLMHGTWGGIAAGALFVLPSVVILIGLSWIYMVYGTVPVVTGILAGLKPAVTAIVIHAAWRLARRAVNTWAFACISLAAFIAVRFASLPFPWVVAGAALIGFAGNRVWPQLFKVRSEAHSSAAGPDLALIGDASPTPRHARMTFLRVATPIVIGVLLWGTVLMGVGFLARGAALYSEMAALFTKAALLTFGGAYAVLPYVHHAAVSDFHWLTTAQMMDGLALGETTPGPLIMVVAFIGFVAGWAREAMGPEALVLAGATGALVATFFTFLPSFVFILAGGPIIESTRGNLHLAAPLTGITAAVVGVIANLAVFFASNALWPVNGSFSIFHLSLLVLSLIALTRFRVGVIWVIGFCGAAGWLASLLPI